MNVEQLEIFQRVADGDLSQDEALALLMQPDGSPASSRPSRAHALSVGQDALWRHYRLNRASSAYNMPMAIRLHPTVDDTALRAAFQDLVDRHDSLRTTIGETNDGSGQANPAAHEVLFRSETIAVSDQAFLDAVGESARCPFDLERGPIFHVTLFSNLTNGARILLQNVHHIVFDGMSMRVAMDDLLKAYEARVDGRAPQWTAPVASYRDFVQWQRQMLGGDAGARLREYWLTQLAGDLPVPVLPLQPNPAARLANGHARLPCPVAPALFKDLKALARRHQSSLYTVLLAAFQVLLHRYTGQTDVIVGTPVSGRPMSSFDSAVGYFANVLPIRAQLDGATPFAAFLKQLQATVQGAHEHSDYPLLTLREDLRRAGHADPLFRAAFYFQDWLKPGRAPRRTSDVADVLGDVLAHIHQEGEYELILEVVQHADRHTVHFRHDANLFTPSDIGRLGSHYEQVLKAIVEDATRRIDDLALLTASERHAHLVEWNDSEAAYPRDQGVIDLFESQVRRRPDAVAVIVGDRSWSYRQVSEQVDRMAARLQALGLGAGDLVGVCTSRSIGMLVSILGALKAGCAYVPLDPAFPLERFTYMIEDSGVSVVLTEGSIVDRLPPLAHPPIVLDTEGDTLCGDPAASLAPVAIRPEDRAYVIYTSGSTGQPKGVQVSHRNLTNFLCGMLAEPGFTEHDHLLAITTISFDIAALELFLPLVCGGKVEILPVEATRSGIALLDRLKKGDITVMQATPSTWQMVLAADWQHRLPLKILCGGEALDRTLAERLIERSAALWNLFGPTETTVWSSAARIEAGGPITIGGPIANTRLYVLDPRLQPVPVGVAGELYIGGDGVSLGYLNRPEQTAARFLPDPFGRAGSIYRTGDAVRRLPDGRIDYLGRLDHQVKIRGHRVELGEIEHVLQGVVEVGEAVVVLRDESTTGPQLVAFVVPKDLRRTPSKDGLRLALDRWLPSYLHPSLSLLQGLPRTLNNKVDRSTLARKPLKLIHAEFGLVEVDALLPPAPAVQRLSEPRDASSQSPARLALSQDLGDRIANLLQIDPAGLDSRVPLGDYGFQSVLFTQLSVEIGRAYGVTVDPTLFYEHKTLASIADHLHGLAPRYAATPPSSTLAEDAQSAVVMAELSPATSPVASRDATLSHEPIAIVGLSARFPGSEDLAGFERKLAAGEALVTEIPPRRWSWQEQPEEVSSRWGGFIDEEDRFDALFFGVSAREAAQMDPQLRLLLESVWSTIEDAGCRPSALAGRQVGVFIGVSGSEYTLLQAEQGFSADSHSLTGLAPTAMANRLSYFFDFHGPSAPVDTACSSSLIAIHRAVRAIRDGQCEVAIAGGVNLLLSPLVYLTLSKTKMLSPDGRCKTFDASADGYVRGEGVATLLLKPLSRALADGDPIHAVIRGSAENHGGRTQSFTAPNPTAQTQLLLRAWRDARIDPTTIGYLEAHGTGTALGDPVEINAIKNAFTAFQQDRGHAGEALPPSTCGISSVKTRIGHLEAAAGIAGLVHAVVAMKRGRLPGNIQLVRPNPYLRLDDGPLYLLDEERPWPRLRDEGGRELPRRAAVSSFGFGGSNAHLIVEEAPSSLQADASNPDAAEQLIVLSARTPERLRAYAVRWAVFLRSKSTPGASLPSLADLALTLRLGREPLPVRLAVVVRDAASLIDKLEAFGRQEQRVADVYTSPPEGVKDDLSAWTRDDDLHELVLKWATKRQWAKLAQLWVRGVTVDWQDVVAPGQRLNGLPTYPFERQRHWFEAATRPGAGASTPPKAALAVDAAVNRDLLYRFDWPIQARGPLGESPFAADPGHWLVFQSDPRQDPRNLGPGLVAELQRLGARCVSVSPGPSFRRAGDRHYELPLAQAEGFVSLLRETSADAGSTLRGVVFLWSLDEPSRLDAGTLDEAQNIGLYSALSLMQAIAASNATPHVYFATAGAVVASDASAPMASREAQASVVPPRCAHAPLWGFVAAAALEYPAMHVAMIDVDAGSADPTQAVAGLLQEVWWPDVEDRIALHGGERRVARLVPWHAAGQVVPRGAPIAACATYLITGGFGMLGLAFAEQLIRRGARHLVLTGRHGAADASARAAVERWRQAGVEVATVNADVADQADVARLFRTMQETMPPLRGVIHAAGLPGFKPIAALGAQDFAALLRPKMKGCWLLHEHTRAADLDFFVLCSSIASAWGSQGQSHYAAANAFLDGFAHHRRALGLPAHSFNCGPWDGGMTSPEAVVALARMGIQAMAREYSLDTVLENLQQSPAQLVMADVDWPVFRSLYEAQRPRSLLRRLGEPAAQENAASAQEPLASAVEPQPRERRRLFALDIGTKVAALLGMPCEQLDPDIELNACGFDSIMAIDLRNMIQRDLGVDLAVAFLMDKLCVRRLRDRLVADVEAMSDDDLQQQAAIVPYVEDHSPFALTPGQEALWFIHKLVPTSPAYHCGTSVRIKGALDPERIRRTFQVLLDRHAALRTSFAMVGETAMQRIRPHEDVVLDRIDASAWTEQVLAARVQQAHERPFDLDNGPLLRLHLFSRSAQDHVLLMTIHHLATDGWSTWVLSNEMMAIYAAIQAGTEPVLAPIAHDYRLFAIQQAQSLQGAEGERLWQYWRGRFPGERPELDLPTDRPRPLVPAYRGATHPFSLGDAGTRLLKRLVQSSGDTLYMVLLAAFKVLLHRYTGQDDIVVGSPAAGRSMAAVSDVIGYFSNALPLRSDLSGNPSFTDFLEQVRDTVLGALDHQDYPSALLAHRLREQGGNDHASLFRVMFIFQKSQHFESPASDAAAGASLDGGPVEWQGLRIEPYELAEEEGQFDITLAMWESGGSVRGALKYDTDLFDAETIHWLAENYLHLLQAIGDDPGRSIAALPMLSNAQRTELLRLGGPVAPAIESTDCMLMHASFEAQAARVPQAEALVSAEQRLTYAELNTQANQLARHLQSLGLRSGACVGIQMESSARMIVAVLAVLKAGGAYVALEPDYPRDRLVAMIADADAQWLLCGDGVEPLAPASAGTVVHVDRDRDAIANQAGHDLGTDVKPDDLAYVVFTSGSTGRPKGVMVTHGNLASIAQSWQRAYRTDDDVRHHLQMAAFSFDVFSGNLARALCSGGKLVLCPRDALLDPGKLYQLMLDERIDCAEFVPVVLRTLATHLEREQKNLHFMRLLIVGSDTWTQEDADRFARLCGPETRLVNSYGASEATIDSTFHDIPHVGGVVAKGAALSIGQAFDNTRLYVVDEHLQLVPRGVAGELCIGGAGVARGYLNRPELTAQKFLQDPFASQPDQRLYRTGDRVRWLGDGHLAFLGRQDSQVKLRGFRIEPGEIEGALAGIAGVLAVAVVVREDIPGDRRLVAYVVGSENVELDIQTLRSALRAQLPDYMIPGAFVVLPALPVSANGKVDRRALPAPRDGDHAREDHVPPRTDTERALCEVWQQVLGMDKVGVNDSFFALGGHSLLAMRAVTLLNNERAIELSLAEFMSHASLADLAAAVDAKETKEPAPAHDVGRMHALLDDLEKLSGEELERLAEESRVLAIGELQ